MDYILHTMYFGIFLVTSRKNRVSLVMMVNTVNVYGIHLLLVPSLIQILESWADIIFSFIRIRLCKYFIFYISGKSSLPPSFIIDFLFLFFFSLLLWSLGHWAKKIMKKRCNENMEQENLMIDVIIINGVGSYWMTDDVLMLMLIFGLYLLLRLSFVIDILIQFTFFNHYWLCSLVYFPCFQVVFIF